MNPVLNPPKSSDARPRGLSFIASSFLALTDMPRTNGRLSPGWAGLLRVAAIALVLALCRLTIKRAQVFSTPEALLRDSIAKNPAAWAAQNDLGCILAQRQNFAEAIEHFTASLQSKHDYREAHLNLGQALAMEGRSREAEEQFLAALDIKPPTADAHKRFARALAMRGRHQEALNHLRVALSFQPEIQTHLDLAGLCYQTGDFGRALVYLRQAALFKPDAPEALNNLAWLLATCSDGNLRNGAEAVRCAKRACLLTSFKHPAMVATLAAAYAEAGRFPAAGATAEMEVKLGTASGHTQLATVSQQLLTLYRAGRAWHELPPGSSGSRL